MNSELPEFQFFQNLGCYKVSHIPQRRSRKRTSTIIPTLYYCNFGSNATAQTNSEVISVFKLEQIVREGDPVRRMLFIVRGHLQSSQALRTGATSRCTLGPGNFSGDELLSWCLRRPFRERLPTASATLVTLESTEAFGLDAADVWYVTRHFRYTFSVL